MSEKILVSACLLGHPVRYDGKSVPLKEIDWLQQLQQQNRLVIVCPEQAGGLPTPRDPAERQQDKIITVNGQDVTQEFDQGAQLALKLCLQHDIKIALLKAKSPSCGNQQIYNGQFNNTLIAGQGMTAELLTKHDIKVYSELEIELLKQPINRT
ncbi:hypothetical protein GCM10008107_20570 [Psychrosphaera saromensis]|uniref:Uncharacterized protein n=1 Tax=Psychrosphaera saromensis TaxID=716813 RepID=A0A2S7URY6_9GAMM|nr:DUF523 domain-containing protein [Psychrosphaera saromensis]PQJ52754.1 hypothetical protein BTO11_03170 [Psychrosphaera saromensis]GHB70971.1 hypothetical protein GCM10008107_20570 [Psychrosphaera saromensis]GLQ13243.1 hypothetical protein GCM10007917_06980 [Psychrosphaera saromensis]